MRSLAGSRILKNNPTQSSPLHDAGRNAESHSDQTHPLGQLTATVSYPDLGPGVSATARRGFFTGFASLVCWRWLLATPGAESDQALSGATASMSRAKSQTTTEVRRSESGRASWYSLASKTASGEQMDSDEMTAAHPSLPFGTQVRVENLDNGRTVTVRVNDRGPFTMSSGEHLEAIPPSLRLFREKPRNPKARCRRLFLFST